MGFTTETFLFVFLPVSVIAYLLVDRLHNVKVNNVLLLILSIVFYAWASLETLWTFLIICGAVYLLGELVYYSNRGGIRKSNKYICISVAVFVAFLAYCKYLPFLIETINKVTTFGLSVKEIAAPIGISFVIFESVSYVVDVYRGEAKPGSFVELCLFLSLFPKLVSGPIVLWRDFQLQVNHHATNMERVAEGLNKIIVGFAKKAILADTFGAQIQVIDNGIAGMGVDAPTMWLKAALYFFQIYYDFSGYSDIAIGLCNIFGFSLKANFNFPYISKSITEFWRRWHISLGSWFREYVYIPLGGNRKGNVYVHLFIVFLLTGIWHGANWTFVLWGVVNGIFVVLERYIRDKTWYKKTPAVIKWVVTVAVVFFAWILFMSPDLDTAVRNYSGLFVSPNPELLNFTWEYYLTKKIVILLIIACVGAVMGAVPLPDKVRKILDTTAGSLIQKVCCILLFIIAVLFVVNSTYSPFLYFQF